MDHKRKLIRNDHGANDCVDVTHQTVLINFDLIKKVINIESFNNQFHFSQCQKSFLALICTISKINFHRYNN